MATVKAHGGERATPPAVPVPDAGGTQVAAAHQPFEQPVPADPVAPTAVDPAAPGGTGLATNADVAPLDALPPELEHTEGQIELSPEMIHEETQHAGVLKETFRLFKGFATTPSPPSIRPPAPAKPGAALDVGEAPAPGGGSAPAAVPGDATPPGEAPAPDAPSQPFVERGAFGRVTIQPADEAQARTFFDDLGIEFSAEINLENLNSIEELEHVTNTLENMIAPAINEERRGHITRAATALMAEQLHFSGEGLAKLLRRQRGEGANAEYITASRMILAESADRLTSLAKMVRDPARSTPEAAFKFRQQMALHGVIQMQFMGARAEIGRALSAFNIPMEALREVGPKLSQRRMTELLEGFGGRKTTEYMAQRWLDMIDNPAGQNKLASKGWSAKTIDAFFHVWINGLLSSPLTHMRNTVGNTLFGAAGTIETQLAGVIGAGRAGVRHLFGKQTPDRGFLGQAAARLIGQIKGLEDGFIMGARALKTGEPQDAMSKMDALQHTGGLSAEAWGVVGNWGRAMDMLDAAIGLPGRALMAEDEFYKAIAKRAHLHELVYTRFQQAQMDGMSKEEALDVAMDAMRNPPEDDILSMEDAARYWTFTNENEGKLGELFVKIQQVPFLGRFVFPFRRTPVNIVKRFLERNMATAWMMPSVRADIKAGGAKLDMVLARMTLGTGMLAMAGTWTYDGMITGGGPRNHRQRKQLRETGWQPWSFKVPKEGGWISGAAMEALVAAGAISEAKDHWYISYLGIEPLGNFLVVASGTADALKWSPYLTHNEELTEIALGAIFDSMSERSFFQGIADVADALRFGPSSFNRYISRVAKGMKPYSSVINKVSRYLDPTLRDTRVDPDVPFGVSQFHAFLNGWAASTSGLAEHMGIKTDLPKEHNIWGDEVAFGEGRWFELVNPFYIKANKYSPVELELVRLGSPIDRPSRDIMGIKLNPHEYQTLVVRQGREVVLNNLTLKEAMDELFNSAEYLDPMVTDEDRIKDVRALHRDYVNAAVAELTGAIFRGRQIIGFDPSVFPELDSLSQKLQDHVEGMGIIERRLPTF